MPSCASSRPAGISLPGRASVRQWASSASRSRLCRPGAVAPSSAATPIRVPRSIHDVDNGQILGFGADLSEDHPGFLDEEYKRRRTMISNIARRHKIGEPIPRIDYTAQERKTWRTVVRELRQLFPTHACKEYLEVLPMFHFDEDEVPQLQDMSDVLSRTTGWSIRPVAGLMHPRDFLNGLAFKCFHSTQYMRHDSKPMYTPEPDLCHELIGHVPMLANPAYCEMVQAIGRISLGADEKLVWRLTKLYWFTVEFGVVREGSEVRAFGAGILSSFGELQHMRQGNPVLQPFDPFAPQPKMSYKDGFQQRYFVLESLEQGAEQLRTYARSLAAADEGVAAT